MKHVLTNKNCVKKKISYLYKNKIILWDLKHANFLMDVFWCPKIADFDINFKAYCFDRAALENSYANSKQKNTPFMTSFFVLWSWYELEKEAQIHQYLGCRKKKS